VAPLRLHRLEEEIRKNQDRHGTKTFVPQMLVNRSASAVPK
jgi:hypothetical protein